MMVTVICLRKDKIRIDGSGSKIALVTKIVRLPLLHGHYQISFCNWNQYVFLLFYVSPLSE